VSVTTIETTRHSLAAAAREEDVMPEEQDITDNVLLPAIQSLLFYLYVAVDIQIPLDSCSYTVTGFCCR
jgi:hypothetical protein